MAKPQGKKVFMSRVRPAGDLPGSWNHYDELKAAEVEITLYEPCASFPQGAAVLSYQPIGVVTRRVTCLEVWLSKSQNWRDLAVPCVGALVSDCPYNGRQFLGFDEAISIIRKLAANRKEATARRNKRTAGLLLLGAVVFGLGGLIAIPVSLQLLDPDTSLSRMYPTAHEWVCRPLFVGVPHLNLYGVILAAWALLLAFLLWRMSVHVTKLEQAAAAAKELEQASEKECLWFLRDSSKVVQSVLKAATSAVVNEAHGRCEAQENEFTQEEREEKVMPRQENAGTIVQYQLSVDELTNIVREYFNSEQPDSVPEGSLGYIIDTANAYKIDHENSLDDDSVVFVLQFNKVFCPKKMKPKLQPDGDVD